MFALLIGTIVLMLPRPEGTKFQISNDTGQIWFPMLRKTVMSYKLRIQIQWIHLDILNEKANKYKFANVQVGYVNGLTPKTKIFLAVLVFARFLFMVEPIPLEITAILIGVSYFAYAPLNIRDAEQTIKSIHSKANAWGLSARKKVNKEELLKTLMGLSKLAIQEEISKVDINPLIVSSDGSIKAVDALIVTSKNYDKKEFSFPVDINRLEPPQLIAFHYFRADGQVKKYYFLISLNQALFSFASFFLVVMEYGIFSPFIARMISSITTYLYLIYILTLWEYKNNKKKGYSKYLSQLFLNNKNNLKIFSNLIEMF